MEMEILWFLNISKNVRNALPFGRIPLSKSTTSTNVALSSNISYFWEHFSMGTFVGWYR